MMPSSVPIRKPPKLEVGSAITATMMPSTPRYVEVAGRNHAPKPNMTNSAPMSSVDTPDTVEIMTSRSEMCTVKYAGVAMTIPESMSNKPGMNGRPPRHV